jgi:hypothetical protein
MEFRPSWKFQPGRKKRKKEEALLPWLLELSRTALGGI